MRISFFGFIRNVFFAYCISFAFITKVIGQANFIVNHVADTTHEHEEYIPFGNETYWKISQHGYLLVNKEHVAILNTHFQNARAIANNRGAVMKNGKWGFIDKIGDLVVPIEYDFVFDFKAVTTAVVKNNNWFLIDSNNTIITHLNIDYFWGFDSSGIAKVTNKNKLAYINIYGVIQAPGWQIDSTSKKISGSAESSTHGDLRAPTFCPNNLDFEIGNFTDWQCYIGDVQGSLHLYPSSQTSNQHDIISYGGGNDFYGGFSLNPPSGPPGSGHAVKLGNPIPGFGAERIEYEITIPAGVTDYSFMYHYALVFEDPSHPFDAQPRFVVQLIDVASGQEVACASVDYTAGYGGASFFSQSPVSGSVFYKPWTPVFINLGRFAGRHLKIQFTTMDCKYGGHWCYAYVDINSCDFSGFTAINSCTTPTTTTLNGPPGFSSYIWSLNPNVSLAPLSSSQNFVLSPGLSLNTPVYVQVVPFNGVACSDTLSTRVIPSFIKSSFPSQPQQCLQNNLFNFNSYSQTTGGVFDSLNWSFGDGIIDSGSSVTHTYSSSGTFPVTLTAINPQGCRDDTIINITVLPAPSVHTNGGDICQGSSALITLTGADLYSWSPRSGLVFTSSVEDSVYLGMNNVTLYTVTATDTTTGCVKDTTISAVFYPKPLAGFVPPAPQCLRNNQFNFSSTSVMPPGSSGSSSITSYLWSFGDDSTSTNSIISHVYDTAGNYTVNLYVTTSDGCKDTSTQIITVNKHPSSNIIASRPLRFCDRDSTTLIAIAEAGSGTIISYQWQENNVPISGANQSNYTVYQSGTYQLELTNSNNCRDTSLSQPIIAHPLPTGFISALPANTDYICDGSTKTLVVNQSTATQYQWYYTNLAQTGPLTAISGADSATLETSLPGYYSLEMTTSTVPACKGFAIDTLRLRTIKKPQPIFGFPTRCTNTPIFFTNTSDTAQAGTIHWLWNFGDLTSDSTMYRPVHTYAIGTNYPVTLWMAPRECPQLENSYSTQIVVEDPVPGMRYPTINGLRYQNIPLQSRTFATSYDWNPHVGLNGYTVSNPIFNYGANTEYLIRMKTNAGCITHDTIKINVFDAADIKVPTAFSPNKDGHNDFLSIFTIGLHHLSYFKVFNRWGQLIYETSNPLKGWNGTYKGVKQPADTYVWIAEGVDMRGSMVARKGQFVLLK